MVSQYPMKRCMVSLENENVQNVHNEQIDNEKKLIQRELMEEEKRIRKEQEAASARSVDVDKSVASLSSIHGEKVEVEAELEEEKDKILGDGLTLVTCEEYAQVLISSQEEPGLKIEDEEKVLPITNMIMNFDHDEINLKEGPKQSLIEEDTDHVELTIEDGILPKDVYDNEDMEMKGNVLQVQDKFFPY
ncbi:unnamed protein product [Linum trigynum]|uniref:Uncharacterized protein n=1 Tax=Linum trigynum TaxID=586398 RepID=A0AAV2FAT1_9ROSI